MSMVAAGLHALTLVLEPMRLLFLLIGVVFGLSLGVIPGLGGVVGLAILIPFTYSLDAFTAFALLLGMAATTTVSDLIPAVLFGVPGTVGAAATVLDGHPLAKQGQAGRAFGAGYAASLTGGIFGALLLAVTVPLLRPFVLYLASPELLAFCIFGLSMVATLSGKAPLKGLTAAAIGLMLAMVGSGSQSGTLRWTFDTFYLWDHIPLVPVTLGFFAIPELADLAISRSSIARGAIGGELTIASQWQGVRDAASHWWLILRCSWIGAILGAVPGLGSASIDWIAYGHAVQTEKNTEKFGHGDIRGVIAPESANNAKEGGHLVPTIAFGVPAGASMALLLSAFLMHGFVPGPEMLTKHLDVTYSIIWSLTLAHIMGAGICIAASGLFARLATVRVGILLPLVMAVIFVGAFQGSQSWGDIYALVLFGVIGWVMKQLGWPRPPLILGFVLGTIFERYFYISTQVYGAAWALRPVVVIVLALAAWVVWRPLLASVRDTVGTMRRLHLARPRLDISVGFTAALIVAVLVALFVGRDWPPEAKLVPYAAAYAGLLFAALNLLTELFRAPQPAAAATEGGSESVLLAGSARDGAVRRARAARYFAWSAGFFVLGAGIGFLPALFCFVLLVMRFEFRERWTGALIGAGCVSIALWLLCDRLLALPWPQSLLGDLLPALREATGLV
jgi:putative tricarboxylic transport membrane protein